MTYIPGSGSGGGSIGGSSDVALNNAAGNDVLAYDSSIAKWKNSPVPSPLGSMGNPLTDPAAARPVGVPVVVWRTDSVPANAAVGDWIFLPDGDSSSGGASAVYSEMFDATGLSGWVAKDNSGSLTRDTGRDAGAPGTAIASLRWVAPANGNSSVQSPLISGLTSGSTYIITMKVSNAGAGSLNFRILTDEYDTAGTYIFSQNGLSTMVASNSTFTEITYSLTLQATATQMRVYPQVISAAAGDAFYVDNIAVTG